MVVGAYVSHQSECSFVFFFVCFNSMAPHLANAQYASRLHQINIEFILIISSLIFIFPLLQTERQRKRRRRHDHKCTKQWLDENIKKKTLFQLRFYVQFFLSAALHISRLALRATYFRSSSASSMASHIGPVRASEH